MKICPRCKTRKRIHYEKSKYAETYCRRCSSDRANEYYQKNKEKYRASVRRWQEKNPEKLILYQVRHWTKKHPKEFAVVMGEKPAWKEPSRTELIRHFNMKLMEQNKRL